MLCQLDQDLSPRCLSAITYRPQFTLRETCLGESGTEVWSSPTSRNDGWSNGSNSNVTYDELSFTVASLARDSLPMKCNTRRYHTNWLLHKVSGNIWRRKGRSCEQHTGPGERIWLYAECLFHVLAPVGYTLAVNITSITSVKIHRANAARDGTWCLSDYREVSYIITITTTWRS